MIVQNVGLIDVTIGGLLSRQNVLIENGVIKQLSETSISAEQGELVIDASGKYLMPGLIDMHTHVIDRQDLLLVLSHGVTHN